MDIRSIISDDGDQKFRPVQQAPPRQSPVQSSPKALQHPPPPQVYASPTATYSQAHPYQQSQYQSAPNTRPPVPPSFNRQPSNPYPTLTTAIPPYNAHNQGQPSMSPSAQRQSQHSMSESPVAVSYTHQPGFAHQPPPSHPSTPLGPPSAYNRSSSYHSRDPQSPYTHARTLSNTSHGAPVTTPVSGGVRGRASMVASPGVYDNASPRVERNGSDYSIHRERERTVSVSPKTKVPSRSQSMESRHASHDYDQTAVDGSLRSILHPSPQASQPPPPAQHPPPHLRQAFDHQTQIYHNHSPPPSSFSHPSPKTIPQPSPRPMKSTPQPNIPKSSNSVSPSTRRMHQMPTPPKPPSTVHSMTPPAQPASRASSQLGPPTQPPSGLRKRRRYDPVPIWAQKANSQNKQTIMQKKAMTGPPVQPNGHVAPPVQHPAPPPPQPSSLEPNLANIPPYDDMTRRVMDFLWANVVDNDSAETDISHFEIEAKLGWLRDRNTNARVDVPIASEAVLRSEAWPLIFESDMSERYHQTYNKWLNSETARSTKDANRESIRYVHLRHTDSFYRLPQHGIALLPDYARRTINPQTARIRVTRDTKTGAVVAAIIKVKVANLEIHFPTQELDVRISVNVEVDYKGSLDDLEYNQEEGRRQPNRVKDRLCYHHQFCEVDLTQVTKVEDGGKGGSKTHEVEIELDAAAVRREGRMLKEGGPTKFEELVTTFMNHIRELVRTQLD